MLHEFIATHREVIIARTREKIAARSAPRPTEIEIAHGVPLFLDQLAARLRSDVDSSTQHFGESASRHGGELLDAGLTIGQVVHDYGNVCQAITELAVELKAQITNEDFRTLNMCLDVAIAERSPSTRVGVIRPSSVAAWSSSRSSPTSCGTFSTPPPLPSTPFTPEASPRVAAPRASSRTALPGCATS